MTGSRETFSRPSPVTNGEAPEYTGIDHVAGRKRYWFTYGPLLLAAVGADSEEELSVRNVETMKDMARKLQPQDGRPLRFRFPMQFEDVEFMPYFQVHDEQFSCFPLLKARSGLL